MAIRKDLDGLLLQKPGDPAICLIDQGKKRRVADPPTLVALFGASPTIIQDVNLNDIDSGPDVAENSCLAKPAGGTAIYLIDVAEGTKRHIDTPDTMIRYQFNKGTLNSVPPGLIQVAPNGPTIVWPE